MNDIGNLHGLAQQLSPFKLLRVTLRQEQSPGQLSLPDDVEITEQAANQLSLRVPRSSTPEITAFLLQTLPVADLTVEDPPIEAVIDQVYSEGAV